MDAFKFSISITVRIGDINYGNHAGYHCYFLFFQEARIAYLQQFGFSEHDIAGCAMMISSADCRYKRELFLGDEMTVSCRVSRLKSKLFTMDYQIERAGQVCATGSTTSLCLDPHQKKVAKLPPDFVRAVEVFEGDE